MTETQGEPEDSLYVVSSSPGVSIDGVIIEQILDQKGGAAFARNDHPGRYREEELVRGTSYKVVAKLPWKPPPEPSSYESESSLYAQVRSYIVDHMELRDERGYDVVAAWVLATWLFENCRAAACLYALGPYNSGKTTLLEILEEIAYRAVRAGSISTSAMFRLTDKYHPTLLLDESQVYSEKDKSEIRAIVNEGYRRGGVVWRSSSTDNDYLPVAFECFGFKCFVGTEPPWDALRSRAILLRMFKNTRSLAKTLTPEFFEKGAELRGCLLMYRFGVLERKYSLDLEQQLNLRIQDSRIREIAIPLLRESPDTSNEAILSFLEEMETEQKTEEHTSVEAAYITSVESRLYMVQNGKLAISQVRDGLYETLELDDPRYLPSLKTVRRILSRLGFPPGRMADGKMAVVVDPKHLERVKMRYLPMILQPSQNLDPSKSMDGDPKTPTTDGRTPSPGV